MTPNLIRKSAGSGRCFRCNKLRKVLFQYTLRALIYNPFAKRYCSVACYHSKKQVIRGAHWTSKSPRNPQ